MIGLERAADTIEASGQSGKLATLETSVTELRNEVERLNSKVTISENSLDVSRQIDKAAKSVPNEILVEQFETVMPLLKELYRRLRPHSDWTEIGSDFGGRVRGSLNFTVGEGYNPQFLFSSGQRRAAGLAFLLAIHLSRPWCKWKSLLLDDPVQHVDDYRALNLVEVLSAIRRSGRQIIVAVEDQSLADLLCRRLRSTTSELGRRYDLGGTKDGVPAIVSELMISPLSTETLKLVSSSG
jgi:recombinational DNA repair ATPase RecF